MIPLLFFLFAQTSYLDLIEAHPNGVGKHGSWRAGEIELVVDPAEIEEIEAKSGRKAGVIAEDRYWIWLNDPVRFPSGGSGVYGRILWQNSLEGPPGVAVLPFERKTGLFYLLCQFRHSTRSWEIEMAGGLREAGETAEEAARREVAEETGFAIDQLALLGEMAVDLGMTNTVIPIFLAEVGPKGASDQEESEAIAGLVPLTFEQLLEGIQRGRLYLKINGVERWVHVRCSTLSYALLQLMLMERSFALNPNLP